MARRAGTALVAGTDLGGARRRDWGVAPMSCMRTGGRNGMESATWLATSCAGSNRAGRGAGLLSEPCQGQCIRLCEISRPGCASADDQNYGTRVVNAKVNNALVCMCDVKGMLCEVLVASKPRRRWPASLPSCATPLCAETG